MNRQVFQFVVVTAFIALTACLSYVTSAADTQCIPAKISSGMTACVGRYYAYARMTNDTGGIWITPPTNIVVKSGTLSDISEFPKPYASYAVVQPLGGELCCSSNTVTFPATNNQSYELTVFVISAPPPPTNNEPMILQIQWQ